MLMINLMNPKYYFPVKGEYRLQYANAEIAEELGIPKENIILKQNGDVLELVNGNNTNSVEHIEVDNILMNLGGLKYEQVGGDFNNDFNNDFLNK